MGSDAKKLIDDELWILIEILLPVRARRNRQYAGRKPTPDRAVLTGVVFVLRTGIAWRHPSHSATAVTCIEKSRHSFAAIFA